MDGTILQQVRDLLLSRRRKIYGGKLQDVKTIQESELNSQQVEIIDIAQSLEQFDRESSLAEQERRELAAIERALAKMATGKFGICEECGDDIPSRRLLVLPEARLCAKCQTVEERQQWRTKGAALA